MCFDLPVVQDLDPEQRDCNLPLDGYHLVVGPPGSGKTVLAILRCQQLNNALENATSGAMTRRDSSADSREIAFVVYNNVLKWYVAQSVRERAPSVRVSTFDEYFKEWWIREFPHDELPKLPASPHSTYRPFNWNRIGELVIRQRGRFRKIHHLIVDEAQDLHSNFFPLVPLIADSATIYADENQKITESQVTIEELCRVMGFKTPSCTLKRNHRNTREIAKFAAEYYRGTETGIADLPEKRGRKPVVRKFEDRKQIDFIWAHAELNQELTIGIIVQGSNTNIDKALRHMGLSANALPPNVQIYKSGQYPGKTPMDFCRKGIRVVNQMSAKGLQFDSVFMPFLNKWNPKDDWVSEWMKMYVMASRASQSLFLFYDGDRLPGVLDGVDQSLYKLIDDEED